MKKVVTGIIAALSVCTLAICSTGCDLVDELTNSINTIVNGVVNGNVTDDMDKPDDGKTDNGNKPTDTPNETPKDEVVIISFLVDALPLECEQGMTWTDFCESNYNKNVTLENGVLVTAFWIDGERIVFGVDDSVCYIVDVNAADAIVQDFLYDIDEYGTTITFSLKYHKGMGVYYENFSATSGMTWADFVKSAYNDGTFFIVDEIVYFDAGGNTDKVYGVTPDTFIKNGYEYSKDNISSGGNGNSSVI